MASIRSASTLTRSIAHCSKRCFTRSSSSSSSSSSVPSPPSSSPLAPAPAQRQLGKVSRPLRPNALPTGPPQRKYPKPLPLSLGDQTAQEFMKTLARTPAIRSRPTLINDEACRDLVRAWGVDRMRNVTVVDTYAGAGGLTKAFLELPNVKKVITIEDAFRYHPHLLNLKAEQDEVNPGRMELVEMDSFTWEAYTEAAKHLDQVPTIPWEEPNNNLFFSCQMPNNRHGEQMFVQLVTQAAHKMWYFTRGRFSMGFVGNENYWKKIFAQPGEASHHKLSVLIPSFAHLEYSRIMSDFRPVDTHFHKPRGDPAHVKAIKVTPRAKPLCKNYDALEYVAKHMFVGKAMPWVKGVAAITPGTINLIPLLQEQGLKDLEKTVNKLTLEEWIKIADTFEDWPFRPTNLMDIWGDQEDAR